MYFNRDPFEHALSTLDFFVYAQGCPYTQGGKQNVRSEITSRNGHIQQSFQQCTKVKIQSGRENKHRQQVCN